MIEEIIRTLNAVGIEHQAYYYRTSGGAEVDLIIEGKFGLIPFEIKHAQTIGARQLRPLKDFVREFDCPFGIVVNRDEKLRRYDEKLVGIPFPILAGQHQVG